MHHYATRRGLINYKREVRKTLRNVCVGMRISYFATYLLERDNKAND